MPTPGLFVEVSRCVGSPIQTFGIFKKFKGLGCQPTFGRSDLVVVEAVRQPYTVEVGRIHFHEMRVQLAIEVDIKAVSEADGRQAFDAGFEEGKQRLGLVQHRADLIEA